MRKIEIRPMEPEDWSAVSRIYLEGIATEHATFQTTCPPYSAWDASHAKECRLVLLADGVIEKMPLTAQVAAVSVGIFEDEAVLDLNYAEDSHAIVDCNVVMTSKGEFIEVQGTGEGRPFTDTELRKLLGLGKRGCLTLCRKQAKVMGESL